MRLFSDDEELNPPDPDADPMTGIRFFRDEIPISKKPYKDDGDPNYFGRDDD
jgi:hypothetical protein